MVPSDHWWGVLEDTLLLLGLAAVGLAVFYGLIFLGWILFQCLMR